MRTLRLLAALVKWDFLRELRRMETLPSMVLFAALVLFLAEIGIGQDPRVVGPVGPVVFWIAVLFAGSVGLSQSFAAEREGGALGGLLVAPIDRGTLYFAKVISVSAYVLALEAVTLGLYAVLFNAAPGKNLPALAAVLVVFTLGYIGVGVVLAAMTSALRGGGEVLLRILLLPLMIPMVWLTLRVSETVFETRLAGGSLGPPLEVGTYLLLGSAFDAIYLTVGHLLFPWVLED